MCTEVTSFSVAVAVEKQQRFFVDNLMLGVQLASCTRSIKLSTKNLRCFSNVCTVVKTNFNAYNGTSHMHVASSPDPFSAFQYCMAEKLGMGLHSA